MRAAIAAGLMLFATLECQAASPTANLFGIPRGMKLQDFPHQKSSDPRIARLIKVPRPGPHFVRFMSKTTPANEICRVTGRTYPLEPEAGQSVANSLLSELRESFGAPTLREAKFQVFESEDVLVSAGFLNSGEFYTTMTFKPLSACGEKRPTPVERSFTQ